MNPKRNAWKNTIGITTVTNAIESLGGRISRRKAFRAALVRAYSLCSHSSYFLDKEFQARGAKSLRACYLEEGACPTPADLGRFWARQMLVPWLSDNAKRRCVAELTEVAAGFLRHLETEMCAESNLRPVLACPD